VSKSPIGRLRGASRLTRWTVLVSSSLVLALAFERVHVPAALLLGPLVAGILMSAAGASIVIPRLPLQIAYAMVGCLIARAVTPAAVAEFGSQWPLFLAFSVVTVLASIALGWTMGRLRVLPASTAIWGLMPGAAPVMILMAEDFGADAALVGFMQYLRVVAVAVVVPIISLGLGAVAGTTAYGREWFGPINWIGCGATLLVIVVGIVLGSRMRVSGGVVLVAMFLGAAVNATGTIQLELPALLLAASYALVGWKSGLSFSPDVFRTAAHVFWRVLSSVILLLMMCGALAFILAPLTHADPLSAYLATSPGGIDTVAVIAASSKAQLSLVIAGQTVRVFVVMLVGPPLSRFAVRNLRQRG
jgi:uncharacterized protein